MGVALESPTKDARSRLVDRGGAVALGLLLFFPFLYYPIATVIWLSTPDLAGVYKQALAGGASVLTVGVLVFALLRNRREIRKRLSWRAIARAPETWGLAFLGWMVVVTAFQREPSSVQNLGVYTVFLAAILLAQFKPGYLRAALPVFVWVFVAVFLAVAFAEAVADPFGVMVLSQLGGPRLYASYGVLAVAGIFAIPMDFWLRAILGGGLFAAAVMSNSRASMITLLFVLLLGFTISAQQFWRRALFVVPMGVVVFFSVLQIPQIRDHMVVSHLTTPGLPIDDSGRGRVWAPVIESWSTQPFVGLGAGSSQTIARESDFPLDHPHSEYLRILHDSGLIGFLLFGAFVVLALMWLWPRASGRPRGELVVAGFLIVVAGLVLGTIENYLVFPSLMWPAAVFLGLGLAAARRDGQAPLDPRRRVRAASSENTELPQT